IGMRGLSLPQLPAKRLGQLLKASGIRKQIVVVSACYSGGFIGSSGSFDAVSQDVYDEYGYDLLQSWYPEKAVALYFSYPSSQADITAGEAFVLSASGEEEESIETDRYGHGVFTYFLLEGAYRGDANNDGYITVLELYNYIFGKLEAFTFLPHVSGSPLDFVLFD
ncbi:MAG TPA: hypothetical protein PLG43_08590, partial [Spirochaetia bacterium]|nr:hypothetical protein [Spirochaetia bacterium]